VIKQHSIEALSYPDTETDLSSFTPIKRGINVGATGKAWRIGDDIAFATSDNRITTIGRMANKDARPQTQDLAFSIRRAVKSYNFDNATGEECGNQVFVACKSSNEVNYNDRLLVWNKDYSAWEGYWNISASSLCVHNSKLYYGDSYSGDVYELSGVLNKTVGDSTYPLSCNAKTGWINKTGIGFYLNEISSIAVEGYITSGSSIDINLYKDFSL
jgi:hypothetical protein